MPQEQYWDCGPASAQVVLNGRGVIKSENELINLIGTTENGTDYVGLVQNALNPLLPGANYTSVYFDGKALPTPDQSSSLWANIVKSIDAGYGLVLNWDAPPNNHPIGIKGSSSPNYGSGEIMHYVAAMGYDDAEHAVWIADPGFSPFGYWISFDQCASLVPPKGYTYANVSTPAPVPAPTPDPTPAPTPVPDPVVGQDTLWADVSEFQVAVDDSYPYAVLAIRSNDGTYQDHKFAQNYQWCVNAVKSGKLKFFIVYFYWRPNWQDCVNTMQAMIKAAGGPHPNMVAMIDVERGGNPAGDFSDSLNATDDALVQWLGDPKRVIAYGNTGDLDGMWSNRREDQLIVAAYGANPDYPGKFAHQYTDGNGYGGGLPEGCPPFGNCDMNSADGYSPDSLAAALGVAGTKPGGPFMALTDQQQADLYNAIMGIAAVVVDSQTQLRGPAQNGWQQLGQNQSGLNLTGVDALSVTDPNHNSLGAFVAAIKAGVDSLVAKEAK